MIAILKYVFLGLLLYIFIIPILEQLAVLICQWLENLKGHLLYKSAVLQNSTWRIWNDNYDQTFTTDSNEFVAYVSNGYYYYHSSQIDGNKFDNCPIKYTINTSVGEIENYTKYSISPSDFTLPPKYSGLCILEKNV